MPKELSPPIHLEPGQEVHAPDRLNEIMEAAKPLGFFDYVELPLIFARMKYALDFERDRLGQILDRSEMNYVADVINGYGRRMDLALPFVSAGQVILPNCEDAHRFLQQGLNHFAAEEAGERVAGLIKKIEELSPIQALALLNAVQDFWEDDPRPDFMTVEWWLPRL